MRVKSGSEDRGLHIVRGWALYHSGDWEQAKKVFAEVANAKPKESKESIGVIEERLMPSVYRFR